MRNSKYTKCYLSEVGHKNFMYPSDSIVLLAPDCEIVALPWVGGHADRLKPIKVLKSCLLPVKVNENVKQSSSLLKGKGYTVVWVSEELIAP